MAKHATTNWRRGDVLACVPNARMVRDELGRTLRRTTLLRRLLRLADANDRSKALDEALVSGDRTPGGAK